MEQAGGPWRAMRVGGQIGLSLFSGLGLLSGVSGVGAEGSSR